jgi:hypothetical protein
MPLSEEAKDSAIIDKDSLTTLTSVISDIICHGLKGGHSEGERKPSARENILAQ